MDDLDREIEEAARDARRRVWRGRLATIASTVTFFVVAVAGTIALFELFPEPDVSEFDAHRLEHQAQSGDPSASAIVDDYSAYRRDQGRMRWKIVPSVALAFASAYFVRKRLKPAD